MRTGNELIDDVIEEQGWNDNSVAKVALRFIDDEGLMEEFENYVASMAEEENEEFDVEEED